MEIALCKYQCATCHADIEQDGYLIIEAEDAEAKAVLLSGEINRVLTEECQRDNQCRLNLPLLYHDSSQAFLMIFVPNLRDLSLEDLNDFIRIPYGMLVENAAASLGIELPEPDEAAFPRGEEADYLKQPGIRFHSLTQEQAIALLPEYLLRPTIVDNMDVLRSAVQAVGEEMSGAQVVDDMARLQLINQIIATSEPIERRKLLHHNEPYLNDELYNVLDILAEQMDTDVQPEMAAKLRWTKQQVEKYKQSQQQRLKSRPKPAGATATTDSPPPEDNDEDHSG